MDAQWLAILALLAVFLLVLDCVCRWPRTSVPGRGVMAAAAHLHLHLPRRRYEPPPPPPVRPFEALVADARRLAFRIDHPRGLSYAKQRALQCAYDRVLGEVCDAIEVPHLLGVLPEGAELDAERARVESMLWLAGVHLDGAA